MRVALAVAAGYFLGRTRKMKAALMLAGAGATGRLPSSSQGLVREGVKRLGNSAEVSKLAESLRGELVDAAKHAAVAAASNRIDALTDRIEGVTEGVTKGVTGVLAPEEEHEDTEASEAEDDSARDKGTASEERPKKSTAADRDDEDRAGEHHDGDGHTEAPRRRSTSTRARSTRSSSPRTRKAAQPKTRTTSRSASSDDAPVRRTGR
ncbi:hypothetical protein [Prescottella agglutinans]|nr:hypothetical protein [Prescottella agglutinans]